MGWRLYNISYITGAVFFFFIIVFWHRMQDSIVGMWWFKGVQHYHSQQSQTSSWAADTGYIVVVWSLWSDELMFYSSPCMSLLFPTVTFSLYFWLCTVRLLTISDGICDWKGRFSKAVNTDVEKKLCKKKLRQKMNYCKSFSYDMFVKYLYSKECNQFPFCFFLQGELPKIWSALIPSNLNICSINRLSYSWKKYMTLFIPKTC